MQLITMAHFGEAQGVIQNFGLSRVKPDYYSGAGLTLIITGEGPFEAAVKTASALAENHYERVINLGIAGSLSPNLEIGETTEIRTIYLLLEDKTTFKTFEASKSGVDLLTSFERILDETRAEKFRGFGSLVDREAWGVAMATKAAGVPFSCYKVVSDKAGSLGACELVKERSLEFSEILSELLSDILERPKHNFETDLMLPGGLHFTFSMKHRLKSLSSKLVNKTGLSLNELYDLVRLSEIKELELTPKEKALILMDRLEDKLDPFKTPAKKIIEEIKQAARARGLEVQADPMLENPEIQITFTVRNNQELEHKARTLTELDLGSFEQLMNGGIHVE